MRKTKRIKSVKLTDFLKNLILSDILISKSKQYYSEKIINPEYALALIKQFLLVTSCYIRRHPSTVPILLVQSQEEKSYIDFCLSKIGLAHYIRVFTSLKRLKAIKGGKIILVLDNGIIPNWDTFLKRCLLNQDFFIFRVNNYLPFKNDLGIYTLFGQFDSLKKLLFFLLLLKRAFKLSRTPSSTVQFFLKKFFSKSKKFLKKKTKLYKHNKNRGKGPRLIAPYNSSSNYSKNINTSNYAPYKKI